MKHSQNIKYPFDLTQGKQTLKALLVILVSAFLFLNLISSQLISSLYFGFINNDKTATISFLQKIKKLPEYQNVLNMNNNIYGNSVKEEILRQENKKKEVIYNLEQQLIINPKARDVLYSLYKLTKDDNYLKQARKVDPMLK